MEDTDEEQTSLLDTSSTEPRPTPSSSSYCPSYCPSLNIVLLIVCISLIHSEQNLLAPNLSAVATSFGLNAAEKDEQLGGGLAVALFIIGAPAALLVGMAADGWARRVDLLTLVLLIGTLGCSGSAIAQNYPQMFIARALTGVSLGAAMPLTFSLLGDLAGPAQRTAISGRLGLAMHFGSAGGQGLSGFIGSAFGWRSPFVLLAVAMLAAAAWVRLGMTEPSRPAKAKAAPARGAAASAGSWSALFRVRTVGLILLQGIVGCIPWGVIGAFLPDYLHADCGFTVPESTLIMGGLSIGGGLGTMVGGELGQMLYDRSPRLPAGLMFVSGILDIVPMFILVRWTPSAIWACALLAACGGFFATQTGPVVRATLTNVTHTQQRGLAFATFALCDDLGKGMGPAVLALAVRRFGRRATFAWAMLGWLPCAFICGATAWTVVADEVREGAPGAPDGRREV